MRRRQRVKKIRPEDVLTSRVANFLRLTYPTVIFRFDLAADMPLPIGLAKRGKALHGKFNTGYPDLILLRTTKKFGALFIELKAGDKVPNTEHTRRQAYIHQILRGAGYKVEFCCGFEQTKEVINEYMKLEGRK